MKSSFDRRIIGAWLMLTFLFFLVGAIRWETGVLSILGMSAFQGLRFVLVMKSDADNRSTKVIYSQASPDGVVTAKIEEGIIGKPSLLRKTPNPYFSCWVKRTYQDGVYLQEEELDSRDAAESWLANIYQQELEKHLERLSDVET